MSIKPIGDSARLAIGKALRYSNAGISKKMMDLQIIISSSKAIQRSDYFVLRAKQAIARTLSIIKGNDALIIGDNAESLDKKSIAINGITSFLVYLKNSSTTITITPNNPLVHSFFYITQISPIYKYALSLPINPSIFGANALGAQSTPITMQTASVYRIDVVVGDSSAADRGGIASIASSGQGFIYEDMSKFRTRGWILPAAYLLGHHAQNPLVFALPIPANTNVSVRLTGEITYQGWNLAYKGLNDQYFIKTYNGGTGIEDITISLPVSQNNELYYIQADSSSAHDENASLWIESTNKNVFLYADIPYYIKRINSTTQSGFIFNTTSYLKSFNIDVDANEKTSLDVTKLENTSFNAYVDVGSGPINFSGEAIKVDLPVSNTSQQYGVEVISTKTHLGPGPFVSPNEQFIFQYQPSLPIYFSYPPSIRNEQSSGVWDKIGSLWVYNSAYSNILFDHWVGIIAYYGADPYPSGARVFLPAASFNIGLPINMRPNWVSDAVIVNVYPSTPSGDSALYSPIVTGSGDTKDVTWQKNGGGWSSSYQGGVNGNPIRFTYQGLYADNDINNNLSSIQGSLDIAPDNAPNDWYGKNWVFNGRISYIYGHIGIASGGWTNTPLNLPIVIDRETITDNIGKISGHISGWGSFV